MGLLDTLKNVFKPNVGSDAEPSSLASASTYTIPANKNGSTTGSNFNIGSNTGVHANVVPGSNNGITGTPVPLVNSGNEVGVRAGITSGIDKGAGKASYSPGATDTTKAGSLNIVNSTTSNNKTTNTTFKPKVGQTEDSISVRAGNDERFKYDRASDKLSERAHRAGLRAGEDYDNISGDQREFIDTYYNTLDRAEIAKPFLELEGLIRDKDYSSDKFDTKYQQLMNYIDEELEAERKANGATSKQYQALEQVKQDVTRLGAQYAVDKQYAQSQGASGQLDESINAIFAGVMNSRDYDSTVNAGRQAVSQNASAKKWFDKNMANASETQRNLMYYTYQKEGMAGVKELYNDYLGETLSYADASKDFISDIVNNPGKGDRFWEAAKANVASTLGGTGSYVSSIKQMFSDTESDPSNRELIAGYTANDAIDTSLRDELGAIADSPEFEQIGNEGFAMMRAYGVNDDWYKDAAKNATDFQKQFLGYMFAATDGDATAVQAVWESIKESEEEIWQQVKGTNTLPYGRDTVEGDIYRRYLGLSGGKAPTWLGGGDGQTMSQLLWDAASTVNGQVPQLIGNLAGLALALIPGGQALAPFASRVLGAGAMTIGAYGNTYKATRDEGYNKTKSGVYAGADAAMEFISDYLFSGIGPVKGLLNNKMTSKIVANIANPIARAFSKLGINMLSEGGQEYFQAINEPLMRNVLLGESNDFSLYTEEAKYNFFMGAFSAAILGSLDADTNLMRQVRENVQNKDVGQALKAQGSAKKLVDVVLNQEVAAENKEQQEKVDEAKEFAKSLLDGDFKESDTNVGELLSKAAEAGFDLSFLTNPDTVSYTKEQLSVDDLRAGAVSRLAALGGNTEMAEDVAKLAKGMSVSEESQSAIQKDTAATQVLQELQGELNLEENNALTIAARSSQVDGTFAKITAAVQANNPDKTILSPNAQFIKEQGVGLADAQRIGAVFDKVMDGHQITKDEAKLVNVRNKGVQGALLARLDIDLLETASTDAVMKALNEKAAQIARVKDMQAGVKQATQARVSGQAGTTPASKATQSARQRRRGKKNGTKGTSVQAQAGTEAAAGVSGQLAGSSTGAPQAGNPRGTAGTGPASAGGPGGVRAEDGSSQIGRNAPVRGPGDGDVGEVIPVDQLTEKQRNTQRRLAADGFGSIQFMNGGVSHIVWNEDLGCYEVYIRADGPFNTDQYGDHETGHLWVKALSVNDKHDFLRLVKNVFGEDFREAFTQIRQKYVGLGVFPKDVDEDTVVEEMYCFARGAQNCSKKGLKDSILKFDFSKYHDAMLEIEQIANLEDMAKGNLNNEQVRQNYENGNFNREYYERQGYLDEDFAPAPQQKAEEKKPTIPAKKKNSNPTFGSAEDRAQYVHDKLSPDGSNLAEAIDDGRIYHGGIFEVPFDVQKNSDGTYSVFFKDPVGDSAGDLVVRGIGQGKFKSLDKAFAAAYDACYAYDQAYKNSNQDLGVAEKALADSLSGKKSTTEKRTEAKKTLDKLADKKEKSAEKPKTEKATEVKTEKATEAETEKPKKSKSKKATIPAKSEVDKLKEHYDQRKAAQQRKFDEGKLSKTEEQLKNKLKKLDNEYQHKLIDLYRGEDGNFTATPEAIARAENLSDEVRNDLISELAGLQAELKADSSIADNTGFLNRVQAWFDKANAALNEANKPKVSALQELRSRAEQLVANPELANDPEFVRRNEELLALATAEMAERAANAQVDAEQLAEEASQEAQPEARQETQQEAQPETEPSFDYDAELKKLDDWRNARRKSQYEKMAKNPAKSDASLNAQLKKIEDQYNYKKQALAAKARRNGDTRFSVDPDMNTEENNGRADAVRESYGRAVGSAGGRGTDSRGPGSVQGTEGKSLGPREGVRGQKGVKNKTLARAQFEEKKRRLKANGVKFLSDAEVHPDISAAGSFIKQMIPGANVGYYSDPNDMRDAFFVFRKDTGTDSGIFINAARFDGGVTKDSIPAHKIAVHETGHYYLAYAAMASGVSRKAELAADCFRYVRDQISANSENAAEVLEELADVFEVYRDRYSELTSSDQVMEELVNDLFARNDADFFDEDAFNAIWPLVRDWFQANTEYGSLNDNERAVFSVDPDEDLDVEDLMDRTDEMRSGYNEAQIWQDSSLNEEDVTDTDIAQPSADDDYDAKMDALMAEMDAHPERMEEIVAQMTALAEERSASNTRALEERSTKSKPKKTEQKKPAAAKSFQPKTEPAKADWTELAKADWPDVSKWAHFNTPINDISKIFYDGSTDSYHVEFKDGSVPVDYRSDGTFEFPEVLAAESKRKPEPKKTEQKKSVIPPKTEPKKAETKTEPKKAEAKAEKPAAAKAFQPKAEKAKPAPVNEATPELKKPELHRGQNPVDVKGLDKKKAIDKVTRAKADYESWYAQEKSKLDKLYDDKKIEDAKYAKEFSKLTERRNKDVGRYNDQLKRLEVLEEAVKEKPTVIKDKETTYTPKVGEWWRRIKNGSDIQIRRLRSDRNTYDVSFTDSKGNQVVYESVSPSMLEKALGEGFRSKAEAKSILAAAYDSAASSLGEWQSVDYAKRAEEKKPGKPKPERALDNYGRKIPYRMEARMANSTVRDSAGRLLSVYRLGPANGTQNANPNARYTLWAERPATMNLMRGLNGVEAYDQAGKKVGANIEKWLQELEEHPKMSEGNKNAIRAKIAAAERQMREYTTHITRLDPFREGYTNPKRADVIGNKTLLEGYVDIRNPLVIDAKGKGMAFVRDTIQDFVNDPANLAGQVDVDGNALGEHDGIKFINVTVTDGNKSLGGGQLDRDTIYATFRANQGKSTYNTNPTDSELMQYAIDPDTETGYAEGTLEDTILKIMQDKDEAHAIESLAMFLSQFLQTGVLPEIEDEKTRNIFQRQVTPAEQAFLRQRASDLINKYGRLEQGENPARDVALPRRTEDGNIRRVFRTAAESQHTPERAVPVITREAMTRDGATYQTITDKNAIAAADRDMRKKGFNQVLAEWRAKVDGDVEGLGSITKYDIAKGEMLYIEAVKVGDMDTAMQTLAELAEVGTTAGQVVQAMRMLKNMPKSYQLYYMRRVVNRLNSQYAKRINSGRMSELTIDKDLARAVLNAQSQEELDTAMENLIKNVAGQIPSTFSDKWNAWRYLSMLGNPKTHIRNILGNAIFMPAKFSKDLIAAGLEGMFIKNRSERRTSIKGLLGRNTDYREFAQNDYEGIKDELQSGGKYNPANEIMDARTIFKSKTLEFLRQFNGEMLEKEDGLFLRTHYVNALTNFLATQGVSVDELTTTKQGRKILNAARQYAFNEAQKATYRDASQVAAALNQMKRNTGAIGILLEGVLPFTKTPVNILKRGVEYSPIGLLKTLSYNAMQLKNGDINANDFIDNLAAGLTGTGVAALGWWLASMGVLRGGGDDDDKQSEFDQLQGYQNYSINIGNYNFTVDWTAPVALPLFVGCELFKQLREGGQLTLADWTNSLLVIAEPITQLSMLSGVNDLLTSAKWDEHPFVSALMTMTSSYFTQALPTLVAQLSRSLSEDRRTTFVDKNSDIPQPIQRWWQTNVLGKTPLNAQRTEYIDAWGRKDTTSSFAIRLFENMLSPGYINRVKTTAVDEELQELADRVGTGVLMTVPERSIEFNNETHHLTAQQYQTFAKTRGDAAMEMLTDLFNSDGYQNEMTDSEKAYAVNLIKQYATTIGKKAVFGEYDPTTDNWAEKCDGDQTRITNTAMLKAIAHDAGITYGNNSKAYGLITEQTWLTPVDQAYAIAQLLDLGSDKYVYENKNGPKYAINAEQKQIIAEHFRQIFPAYYVDLASTQQWTNADPEQKLDLLSGVRAEAKADAKSWLAHILAQQGDAPLYVKD